MPAKEYRKIMKHGTSGVIAIPKSYRNYYGLEPGSTVIILYDTLLVLVPKSQEKILREKAQLINRLLGEAK